MSRPNGYVPNLKEPITVCMVHIMALAAAMSLFHDVNAERAAYGLRPLVLDVRLAAAAAEHAADMARRRYFAHESEDGASPFDRMRAQGCAFSYAGENIALAPDAQQADSVLFNSAPHRSNTLSPSYTRVGIAAARDANGTLYFVEDFSN